MEGGGGKGLLFNGLCFVSLLLTAPFQSLLKISLLLSVLPAKIVLKGTRGSGCSLKHSVKARAIRRESSDGQREGGGRLSKSSLSPKESRGKESR